MIEINAFVHRSRAVNVVRALRRGEFTLSVCDEHGAIEDLDLNSPQCPTKNDASASTDILLKIVCENNRREEVIAIIRNYTEGDFSSSSSASSNFRVSITDVIPT